LPARYVIHTVGPVYGRESGREAELLAACYQNSLLLALEHQVASIAFPSISTGVFRFPKPEAAKISSQTIKQFLTANHQIKEIRLVFFQEEDARVFLDHQEFE
jgi:O-acetyl-ADP-ribose deacetylase (regulator of RNase III)